MPSSQLTMCHPVPYSHRKAALAHRGARILTLLCHVDVLYFQHIDVLDPVEGYVIDPLSTCFQVSQIHIGDFYEIYI